MPSSPNPEGSREAAAQRLLLYLQSCHLPAERSLELALEVLRELPEDAEPAEAVARLQDRLRTVEPEGFPPARPAIRRASMPSQYLGRARGGDRHAKARSASRRSQVLTLVFLIALLVLTLQLSYWVPSIDVPVEQPQLSDLLPSLDTGKQQPPLPGTAVSTRTATDIAGRRRFVVDFEGEALSLLPANAKVRAVVTCSTGATTSDQLVIKNETTGGWGLSFMVTVDASSPIDALLPGKPSPVELHAFLHINQIVLTETWNYAFKP